MEPLGQLAQVVGRQLPLALEDLRAHARVDAEQPGQVGAAHVVLFEQIFERVKPADPAGVDGVVLRLVGLHKLREGLKVDRLPLGQPGDGHQPIDHLGGVLQLDVVGDGLRRHQPDQLLEAAGQLVLIVAGLAHDSILPLALVVVGVRQHLADVDQLVVVPDARDEAVLVAADVEHGQRLAAPVRDAIGLGQVRPQLLEALPPGVQSQLVPLPQRRLGVGMPRPELAQAFEADHAHLDILSIRRPAVKPG